MSSGVLWVAQTVLLPARPDKGQCGMRSTGRLAAS